MKIKKQKVSPRQKMINLMYVLLMAMLALNVSSDVLNGFSLVDESLTRSNESTSAHNETLLNSFEEMFKKNPDKVRQWLHHAKEVKEKSDSLYQYADQLKLLIAQAADGKEADPHNLKNRENLEASTFVMLSQDKQGEMLYNKINEYREFMMEHVDTPEQMEMIENSLDTEEHANALNKNWQEYHFESMPAIAAITLLTKIQNDVRYVEGEVLHTLYKKIDLGDVRVNDIKALVIPTATNIVQGGKFSAQIILAAVDSTQRPRIYIDNKLFDSKDGVYTVNCDKPGDYTLSGHMVVNGAKKSYHFEQKYTVVPPPTATVSATMMNVLYAGYENPMSVSVPGIPANKVSMRIKKGSAKIRSNGKKGYIVIPTKVGEELKIAVTALNDEGRTINIGEYPFRVRQLPDPTPFIEYKDKDGHTKRYRGGTKFNKRTLLSTKGITAAIDDGLLNIGFKVLSFETIFFGRTGDAKRLVSQTSLFTEEQKNEISNLGRGKRFYITNVMAEGPDKVKRRLPVLEVIIE